MDKHATVVLDGHMVIPLIGVPPEHTQEVCVRCGQAKHLSEILLDVDAKPVCLACHAKEKPNKNLG